MSVSKYQMFLKTVECGSFSRAAEELNFTQSGVSHAVQALEDELGITLLSRNRGGVVLTADGRALLPRVEALCAAHHALMQSAADLKGLDAGLVKVATFSSVSAQWLPSILKSFGDVYPNIEFEVVDADFYGQTEEWILQGKVDCGFLRLPSAKSLCAHPLYRDELLVVVPCGHPLTDASAFPLSALSAEPFIRLEEGRDYELTAALDAMGVHPNVKYTAREDRTILAMVSKGLGISLLPELMVRRSPYPVAACHAPERFYRNIGIAVKDEKAQSASTPPPLRGLRPPLGGRKRRGLTSHAFPLGADEVSPRSGVKLPRPRRSRGRAEIRDHGRLTRGRSSKSRERNAPCFSILSHLLTCRSSGSADPRRPCRDGPRRGPSRGRCRGWRPDCTSWPASPARTCRR